MTEVLLMVAIALLIAALLSPSPLSVVFLVLSVAAFIIWLVTVVVTERGRHR